MATAGEVERLAAEAWAFRYQVEREAEVRFERLAARLEHLLAAPELVSLARHAAADETRHAARCAERVRGYGAEVPAGPFEPAETAPSWLPERERILYEVTAACCVAETASMAVLTTLLARVREPGLRALLRELAGDEVGHARLGWAHLAGEQRAGAAAFLAPLLPAMLEGNADPGLFDPPRPGEDDPALLEHGVLPHRERREVFVRAVQAVMLPGLEAVGVDVRPARAWLAGRLAPR